MKKSLVIDYWPLACTSVTSAVNVRSVRSFTTVSVTLSPGFFLLTYEVMVLLLVTSVSSIFV